MLSGNLQLKPRAHLVHRRNDIPPFFKLFQVFSVMLTQSDRSSQPFLLELLHFCPGFPRRHLEDPLRSIESTT